MKLLLALLVLTSCAHKTNEDAPDWVQGIRSGQESLKVTNGNKTLYRRISSVSENENEACEDAINKAEEDVKREHPLFPTIPYSLEVLYYDKGRNECAVTISINAALTHKYEQLKHLAGDYKKREEELEKSLSEVRSERRDLAQKYDELQAYITKNAHLLKKVDDMNSRVERIKSAVNDLTNRAQQYAIVGLSEARFKRALGENFYTTSSYYKDLCGVEFRSVTKSQHGLTVVCWKSGHIVGYCDLREQRCSQNWP